jgi:hypothetical protein
MPAQTRTVSSIFFNLEKVLLRQTPRLAQALLGVRWTFAWPKPSIRRELIEYSFPPGPIPFDDELLSQTGVRVTSHDDKDKEALTRHLALGRDAIIAVDSFLLPYRPAFGRVHSHRTIIVRASDKPGEVWVDDAWPPSFQGALPWTVIENARYSAVSLDPWREPIFAGRPINGEWFSVELDWFPILDAADWARDLLQKIFLRANTTTTDEHGEYGLTAIKSFTRELIVAADASPAQRFRFFREASLLLRAELSARVYFCALLRAASVWLKDPQLKEEANEYYASLRHMESARDVLTKSLRQFRAVYSDYLLECLRLALAAEERFGTYLSRYSTGFAN